jgi:hypothetical protein
VSRGDNGKIVVRAVRIAVPLRVDGRLDEPVYQLVKPISDFIQTVPAEGMPATERTEAWILFDDNFIYVVGKCYDSAPPEQWTANELRRDTNQLRQNDSFGVLFDTFHDRRNGFLFYANPLGGFADQWVTDEGNPNVDWNPVWQVRTGRFEGGWTVELAIPFKSLRYNSGLNQVWGIQLRRAIRRKNEWTHLTALPASTNGSLGIFRVSLGATLVGLDLPPASKNVELKPYGIVRQTRDLSKTDPDDASADAGIDAKFGITANLTADFTVNTDFAQVEVDEQQVNLTRFPIQFPEKRDFFLEGRGTFDFARASSGATGGAPASANANPVNGTPTVFYSRRIGLDGGRVIPIDVGERLTGKVGDFSVGVINIQTRELDAPPAPDTTFTIVRVKRDILARSSIGAIVTNRSESLVVPGSSNQAFGVDALFSFFQDLNLLAYWARSITDGLDADRDSYQGRVDYAPDRYGFKVDYLCVGDNFNPEVGFVRRDNFCRTFASGRFSPRPKRSRRVRKYTLEGTTERLVNGADALESQVQIGRFVTEFQTSDVFTVQATRNHELLVRPFTPPGGVIIPPGTYEFSDATASYQIGQQRRVSGLISVQAGEFYDGTIRAVTYSAGRISLLKQWSLEPSFSVNHITLPAGDFTTSVVRARSDYGFSSRMFVGGLVQVSTADDLYSTNVRFRWEYQPGSELFVVYTDERSTDNPSSFYPALKNRAFVVKINRLFRF